ncbi:hypothetical protein O997_02410 [Anaplasma phagocytophilum str. MRK]|nr:hypothetical protein O997_02410 [Anaplasma phagocytophilum str. MRK]
MEQVEERIASLLSALIPYSTIKCAMRSGIADNAPQIFESSSCLCCSESACAFITHSAFCIQELNDSKSPSCSFLLEILSV